MRVLFFVDDRAMPENSLIANINSKHKYWVLHENFICGG